MSFNAYNLTNQKLSANELKTLLKFCTDDYSGVFGTSNPVSVSGTNYKTVNVNTSNAYDFITDGFLIGGTIPGNATYTLNSTTHKLLTLVITTSIDTYSITSNEITTNVSVEWNTELELSKDSSDRYILTQNGTTVWEQYKTLVSYRSLDNVVSTYIIPLAGLYNNTGVVLLGCMSKSSLEEFLTQSAINALTSVLDDRFVWRSGGATKGNIGNLNITENNLTATTGSIVLKSPVVFQSSLSGNGLETYLANYKTSKLDPNYVFRSGGAGKGNIGDLNITNNVISNRPGTGNDRINISANYIRFDKLASRSAVNDPEGWPLLIEANGNVFPKHFLAISHGGTGAEKWDIARENFNIYFKKYNMSIDAAINRVKEDLGTRPMGTVCFVIANYNDKNTLAVGVKRTHTQYGAWDFITGTQK